MCACGLGSCAPSILASKQACAWMAYLRCVRVGSVGWFRAQKHMFWVLLAHPAHRVLHSLTGCGPCTTLPYIDQPVGVLWRLPVTAGFGLVQPQRAKVAASAGCCRMCLVAVLWCGLCYNLRRDFVYTRVSHAACCGGCLCSRAAGLFARLLVVCLWLAPLCGWRAVPLTSSWRLRSLPDWCAAHSCCCARAGCVASVCAGWVAWSGGAASFVPFLHARKTTRPGGRVLCTYAASCCRLFAGGAGAGGYLWVGARVCWCGCGSQARVCLRWSCRVGATRTPTRVGLLYNRCTACLGLCMCTAHGVVDVVVVASGGPVQQFASKHVSLAADSGGSVVFARQLWGVLPWQCSSWGTTGGLCGTTPHVQCRACWCWQPVDVSHAASGQAGVEHAHHGCARAQWLAAFWGSASSCLLLLTTFVSHVLSSHRTVAEIGKACVSVGRASRSPEGYMGRRLTVWWCMASCVRTGLSW